MSTRLHRSATQSLKLPPEFEDLTGVIQNDLKVIVKILGDRADQRLLLSKRQSQQLRRTLWDCLVDSIRQGLEPLKVEHR